jgi:hypothetical protein
MKERALISTLRWLHQLWRDFICLLLDGMDAINAGVCHHFVERYMIAILLSSCYLYTGQCRVEEINPPAQSWEECSRRGAALLKTLNHTIGDDGWTPVGISCSLQTAPAS